MKIKFKKEELLKTVNKIAKIAFFYKTNEMYNNLKIEAFDEIIFKISSDTAFIKTISSGTITEQGEICVSPCDFVNTINSMNTIDVEVFNDNSYLYIKGLNSEVRLPLLYGEKFIPGPSLDSLKKQQEFNIKNSELIRAFNHCLPFENSKSIISGLNFYLNDEGLLRLCCCSELSACLYFIKDFKITLGDSLNFTIDTRFLKDFKDFFSQDELNISIYSNFLEIKDKNTFLILRFLNKSFPTIEKIIPQSFKQELPLNKKTVEQAFDLIDVVTKNIDAIITYKNKVCKISHKDGVDVEFPINVDIEESFRIEREQLRKVLKLIQEENIILLFNDKPKPILIKTENETFLVSVLVN